MLSKRKLRLEYLSKRWAASTVPGGPNPRVDGAPAIRRRGLIGGSSTVAVGLVIEMGALFARTMLLARLLGASEFGLVISINTLVAFAEMFSSIGIDRYIVYSRDGGQQHSLDVAHTLSWLRGLFGAALVIALAWPTASMLGARDYVFSFALVAFNPLLRGAVHLGPVQMQRSRRFWPAAAADTGAALLGLAAAAIAAVAAPDHRAILWALGAQALGSLALSHILARRLPYRLSFDASRMREALRFGLPLLINGLALAAAFQLDRMVVGIWLGVVDLGIYGLTVTLLTQPITLLLRLATTILQPRLSAAWHADPSGTFPSLVHEFARYGALLGGVGAVGAACLGAPALRLAFGPSFSASDGFFVLMAYVVLFRISRGGLNLLGLAIGRTSDLMVSNIVGAATLPAMIGALYVHAGTTSAAFGVLVGDVLAFAVADARLRRHCGSADRAILHGTAAAAIVTAILGGWVLLAGPPLYARATATAIVLAAAAMVLLAERVSRRAHVGLQ